MNNRVDYIVIKDFEANVPFGSTNILYKYTIGKKVCLRPNGNLAQKWLNQGYIKLATN